MNQAPPPVRGAAPADTDARPQRGIVVPGIGSRLWVDRGSGARRVEARQSGWSAAPQVRLDAAFDPGGTLAVEPAWAPPREPWCTR
jgi:hypothetical protein